jgi:uncharacterized protein (DUF1330 family)
MPAYWVVRVEVTDQNRFAEYIRRNPELLEKHGARYLVRGGKTVSLEGPQENRRIVIIEFPSLVAAESFYHSPEYQQIRQLRLGAATGEIIAAEGV